MYCVSKKRPVIIIGMHRSGTSMVSRLMEREGVFWGVKKDENNESRYFIELNEWLLRELSGRWDNPFGMLSADEVPEDYLRVITTYLEGQLNSYRAINYLGVGKHFKYKNIFDQPGIWGWKDPRTTLLLPIWLKLFPDAKVIHIKRNGIDVASSLRERSRKYLKANSAAYVKRKQLYALLGKRGVFVDAPTCLMLEGGFSLWEHYTSCANRYTEDLGRDQLLELRYEDILSSPKENLEKILIFSGLSATHISDSDLATYIRSDRAYGYKRHPELCDFHEKVSDRLKALGY